MSTKCITHIMSISYIAQLNQPILNYKEITITCESAEYTEIIEAELSDLPFESFSTDLKTLKGYMPDQLFDKQSIDSVLESYRNEISDISISSIKHTNWNAAWEADYEPVKIDQELYIGAPFHERPEGFNHYMTIDPNMSFGTGHHPTTTLMLRSLANQNMSGKKVLDFGCGSGILAIYCDYRGAHGIGVEIDSHAANAARKNLKLNASEKFKIETGDIHAIGEEKYDVILANINKNVIEECLPQLVEALNLGGQLMCSGFLVSDINPLTLMLSNRSFEITATETLEDWALIVAKR